MMVTQFLPVVRREKDQCVIIFLCFHKRLDQPSDLMVQMRDAGIISDLRLADQFFVRRTALGVKYSSLLLQKLRIFPVP